MERPQPKKHAECGCCLEEAPLLMPVGFAPGFPVIVWLCMCLKCRLNTRSDEYTLMESEMRHHKSAKTRAAYGEWLAATV